MYVIDKKSCEPSVKTEKYLVKHALHTCRVLDKWNKNFSLNSAKRLKFNVLTKIKLPVIFCSKVYDQI